MTRRSKHPAVIAALYASFALTQGMALQACGDDHHDDDHGHGDHTHNHDEPVGPPSGAVCPDDSTLTYENFGKTFMEDYCTRCHSSELEGEEARKLAPDGHDFDTIEGIWAVQDHIDQVAAAGPDMVNVKMPVGTPKPTLEERELLGEWLACEAPE